MGRIKGRGIGYKYIMNFSIYKKVFIMLISCAYCNRLHNRGDTCQNRPKNNSRKKETNIITKFRSSRIWQKKRHEIKIRDKYLCQNCKKNGIYQFNKLEVHHITPISKNWNKRLKNDNLITLCCSCHKMADNEEIPISDLLGMIEIEKPVYTFRRPQNGLY
jgi:5-methylcytosine-specific restriction endonuclease McrA